MIIKNVKVYTEEKLFQEGEIVIGNGRFQESSQITEDKNQEVIDGDGCYAIPGLIDIHFHGCKEIGRAHV